MNYISEEEHDVAEALYRLVSLGLVSETDGGYSISVDDEADAIADAYPDMDVMLG